MVKLAMLGNLKPLDQLIAQFETAASTEFVGENSQARNGSKGALERDSEPTRQAAPVTNASNLLAPGRDSLQKATPEMVKVTPPPVAQDSTKSGSNDVKVKRPPTAEESEAIGELRRKFRAK
jgi:hypothetical protein